MNFKERKELMIAVLEEGGTPEEMAERVLAKVITPLLEENDREIFKLEAEIEELQEDIADLEEENEG